jgi:hypothetical protein
MEDYYMKKIFSILALALVAMTVSAIEVPTYSLNKADGAEAHGTITFKVGDATVTSAAEGATVTMTITPNGGWSAGTPTGIWSAAEAKAPNRVDMEKDITLNYQSTDANGVATYTFEMIRANAEISCAYKKLLTNTDISIADISALTYSGVAQTPTVTVTDGETPLVENTDYTVSYSNNVNAALSTAATAPTVTITAVATSDKYAGETTKTFTINKKALEDDFIADIDALTYTGEAQTPAPVVTYNGMTLVAGTDYTVAYSNNIDAAASTDDPAPTVTITAVANSNYSGTAKKTFTIKKAVGELSFNPDRLTKTYGDPNFTHTPTFAGNGKLHYWSMDKSVATVNDETGEVTIVGVGRVNIWARISESDNYNQAQIFYILNVEPKDIEYEDGDITQDENGYTVALTEDADNPNAQPLPSDADLAKLTYSRTLTAPGTGEGDKTIDGQAANLFTVCLPFAPKTDDAAKYYTLSGVSGETLSFSEVATPAANTPYLVAVTGSVNFTEDCTDLEVSSMTINSSTVDGHTFTGTFTGLTNAKSAGKYILQKGNKWGKVTSEKQNVYIPPFRAFVEAPATAAPELGSSFDGNTTGIENIRTVDLNGTERWYDLNGRRIATPAKGINILNGKKVVVK